MVFLFGLKLSNSSKSDSREDRPRGVAVAHIEVLDTSKLRATQSTS
jgi:hypothetical protein